MANTVFPKKVIEAKAKDLLNTRVNHRSMMTIDNSLAENEGVTKTVYVYTYTGKVEKLADGTKNTVRGSISHTDVDYTVQRAQQVFDYTDSEFMKDNSIVDTMLNGANDLMVNEMVEDFYNEARKATNTVTADIDAFCYEDVVDAIATLRIEDESKLFLIIPTAWKAQLRKDEDFKSSRAGEILYNGQIGSICGIPVIATNATEYAYVMTNEAIKLFMKEDVEVEQDRDIETKTNTTVLSTYYICALVDNSKICKIDMA